MLAIDQKIQHNALRLSIAAKGLIHPRHYLEDLLLKADELTERLHRGITMFLTLRAQQCDTLTSGLRRPEELRQRGILQLEQLSQRCSRAMKVYLSIHDQTFCQLHNRLIQASVDKVLERGFCLATDVSGRPICSMSQVPDQIPFTLQFHDGTTPVVRYRKPVQAKLF
jgi:exonuclease VII large subunit